MSTPVPSISWTTVWSNDGKDFVSTCACNAVISGTVDNPDNAQHIVEAAQNGHSH